jgi:hypothetical protein
VRRRFIFHNNTKKTIRNHVVSENKLQNILKMGMKIGRRKHLTLFFMSLVFITACNLIPFATDDVDHLISCVKDVDEQQAAKTLYEIAVSSGVYSGIINLAVESVKEAHREQEAVQALIKLIQEKRHLNDPSDEFVIKGALRTLDWLGEPSRESLPFIESLKNHANHRIADVADVVYSSIKEGTFDHVYRSLGQTPNCEDK